MNRNLPYLTITFLKWFFVDFPLYLFRVFWRIVWLVNNSISFTLNLRLIFTPLYGDYTFMGRLIGFVVRLFQIVFGLALVILLAITAALVPLIWYSIPVYITYEYHVLLLVYLGAFYLFRLATARNKPQKKISAITENNYLESFRPTAVSWVKDVASNMQVTAEMLKHKDLQYILKKLELTGPEFVQKTSEIKVDYRNIEKEAFELAKKNGARYVELEHVFLAAIKLIPKIDVVLSVFNLKFDHVEQTAFWVVSDREKTDKMFLWQEDYELPKMSGAGKGMTGRVTPFLDSISQDYTKMAQYNNIPPMTAHPKVMEELVELIGSSNANVLLIGPPGSGKTSVVKGLARKIAKGETANKAIRFKRIVSVDTAGLLAGTKTAGDISQKITQLMEELKSSGDIVLFFDEIHNFVSGATSEDGSSIFSLLEPHLTDSKMQFIGATNMANFRKYMEPNGSFSRIFHILEVPPTDTAQTISILEDEARKIEHEEGIIVSYPALVEIVQLASKLIHERVFPDKALDVLHRAVTDLKGKKYITKEIIRDEVSELTHVPVSSLSEDESQKLLSISDRIKKRVIGQDHAADQIAKALQRARAGIRDEKKPIASFLFVGTTGVGKTETAKALASEFFDNEETMIRLDMSEYQQADSLSKLIGAPDGSSKGILTEAVRTKPYALLLLDEIEKAYSSVLLTFLQVLDDGRLTDSSGTTVDFTNTIIIATSNVGTKEIQKVMQQKGSQEEMESVALNAVRDHYAPEFLNRFNGLIVFKPLTKDVVHKITNLLLNKVRKIADTKGIKVSFTDELINELVERGYNPEWGARPMARVIEDSVETYLAVKLLSKEVQMGDELVLGTEVFT